MASNAFVLCKIRHNVILAPCYAMEPRVGIDQDLMDRLMRFSEPLQGVILSFSDVELERPYGAIVNEMPFIHCKVLANALVFRPKEGMLLRGIVNKIGSNHIGMLFAGVFNGSVTESELPKGFVHNYAQDCWLGEDGSSISVEDEVDVKVLRVHVAGSMIAIEATMRFSGGRTVKPLSPEKKSSKIRHLNLAANKPAIESVKVKKEKKIKEVDGTNKSEEAKVKLKKAKKVKEEDEGSEKKVKKVKKEKKIEEVDGTNKNEEAQVKLKKAKKVKEEDGESEKKVKKAETVEEAEEKKIRKAKEVEKAKKKARKVHKQQESESAEVENAKPVKKVKEAKEKKEKKSKKRKHETKVVDEKVEEEVEMKPRKHKDKDEKKKKHKKSKHD